MNEVKQMKKRKRALQKACSLFIMFMLTLTTLKAVGGTIDIHLKDFPNAEKAGVTFTLYKVGSMSDDGKAALHEKYDLLPILKMVSIYWCHPIWNLMARLILSL